MLQIEGKILNIVRWLLDVWRRLFNVLGKFTWHCRMITWHLGMITWHCGITWHCQMKTWHCRWKHDIAGLLPDIARYQLDITGYKSDLTMQLTLHIAGWFIWYYRMTSWYCGIYRYLTMWDILMTWQCRMAASHCWMIFLILQNDFLTWPESYLALYGSVECFSHFQGTYS